MLDAELTTMLASDEQHWWYRGRRRVLDAVLSGLELESDATLLDAGCGSGRTLDELARYGRVSGVDLSPTSVAAARGRGHDDVCVAPVERLPFVDDRFDVVTCLDVIEHTPDDVRSLAELRRVTRPGGCLLVTVPAYPSLWSHHDVVNLHYRRYRRTSLVDAAADAGWAPVRTTYFNSLLLAPAALVRLSDRRKRPTPTERSDLDRTPAALNAVLELPLRLEAALVRRGLRLPLGLSLLALFRNVALPDVGTPTPVLPFAAPHPLPAVAAVGPR